METLSSTKQEDMVDVNLSLAMQLQRSPNHSQEDVHVDTCYGPMMNFFAPSIMSYESYHVSVKFSLSSFCSFVPFFWLLKDLGAIWQIFWNYAFLVN